MRACAAISRRVCCDGPCRGTNGDAIIKTQSNDHCKAATLWSSLWATQAIFAPLKILRRLADRIERPAATGVA
jgi:hypothetical protein